MATVCGNLGNVPRQTWQCNVITDMGVLQFFYQLAVPTVLVFRSGNCRQKAKDPAVPRG